MRRREERDADDPQQIHGGEQPHRDGPAAYGPAGAGAPLDPQHGEQGHEEVRDLGHDRLGVVDDGRRGPGREDDEGRRAIAANRRNRAATSTQRDDGRGRHHQLHRRDVQAPDCDDGRQQHREEWRVLHVQWTFHEKDVAVALPRGQRLRERDVGPAVLLQLEGRIERPDRHGDDEDGGRPRGPRGAGPAGGHPVHEVRAQATHRRSPPPRATAGRSTCRRPGERTPAAFAIWERPSSAMRRCSSRAPGRDSG